jgi:hypothetical protein
MRRRAVMALLGSAAWLKTARPLRIGVAPQLLFIADDMVE